MKILAIDDQQLVLLSVKKHLTALGYQVATAMSTESGIKLYNTFNPDLVVLDMNMPEMTGKQLTECTGMEVVKYIRLFLKRETPILVMSGNTNQEIINMNFDLGVDDYLNKPATLDEMALRIKGIIGAPRMDDRNLRLTSSSMIQKNGVGIVIPCYNSEQLLLSDALRDFACNNIGYHLCFVNAGSTDNTLQILYSLKQENEAGITIYNCNAEVGRAEAIRQGVLYLTKYQQLDLIGYLDLSFCNDYRYFDVLVKAIENSNLKVVNGFSVDCKAGLVFLNKVVYKGTNFLARKILGSPGTEFFCKAKLMRRDLAKQMFERSFITNSFFNVEMFRRIQGRFGVNETKAITCEIPIKSETCVKAFKFQ
ncbi:MAG: response regulator [Flavobacteriaceae bacterium]